MFGMDAVDVEVQNCICNLPPESCYDFSPIVQAYYVFNVPLIILRIIFYVMMFLLTDFGLEFNLVSFYTHLIQIILTSYFFAVCSQIASR